MTAYGGCYNSSGGPLSYYNISNFHPPKLIPNATTSGQRPHMKPGCANKRLSVRRNELTGRRL